jgi:hypothetical protein
MAQPDALGALAGRGQEDLGRGAVRVFLQEVVFHLPDAVEPKPICELHLFESITEQPFLRPLQVRPRQLVLVKEAKAHAGRILARYAGSGVQMQIPKPTASSRALFDKLVPDDARVEVKPMFGNVAAFINGNMFMGVFGADVGLKLPDADLRALRDAGGGNFGPSGRPMGGYVSLPESLSEGAAKPWVRKSLAYVSTLPPKVKKPPKKK